MSFTFDGPNKIIVPDVGTTSISVRDLYSRWKDWIATSDNSKYVEAFTVTGGEPVDVAAGVYVTSYFFLQTGWKIRPAEEDHTLSVTSGVLLTDDSSDPFVSTTGAFNVRVRYVAPVYTETVLTGGGGGGTDQATVQAALTAQGYTTARAPNLDRLDIPLSTIAAAVWASVVDGTLTAAQSVRLMNAVLGGKVSGAGTATETFRDVDDSKNRVVTTVDAQGNRTAVARDLT